MFSTQYRDRNLWGRGHTSSNFGKIKAFPGQSRVKQIFGTFWDTGKKSGTVSEIQEQLATMRLVGEARYLYQIPASGKGSTPQ